MCEHRSVERRDVAPADDLLVIHGHEVRTIFAEISQNELARHIQWRSRKKRQIRALSGDGVNSCRKALNVLLRNGQDGPTHACGQQALTNRLLKTYCASQFGA